MRPEGGPSPQKTSLVRALGLIDATKFGRASLVSIVPAQDLDVIVTDDGLEQTVADEYRAAGVRLEIVNA